MQRGVFGTPGGACPKPWLGDRLEQGPAGHELADAGLCSPHPP
jgi:hypothetical protein